MKILSSSKPNIAKKAIPILAGYFMLDGGAMFGVVPKSLWERNHPTTSENLTNWALRCLLLEYDDRLILIDTGTGNKQPAQFFKFFKPSGDTLLAALQKAGYAPEQITDVFLTHLHFDHVGGATKWNNDKTEVITTFQNATYWIHEQHWASAMAPNPREKASFFDDNLLPLRDSKRLHFISNDNHSLPFDIIVANGHTKAQMLPLIETESSKMLYAGDLFPSSNHIKPHYLPAYDVEPLESMREKQEAFEYCIDKGIKLFFEHDPFVQFGLPAVGDRGIFLDAVVRCPNINTVV